MNASEIPMQICAPTVEAPPVPRKGMKKNAFSQNLPKN